MVYFFLSRKISNQTTLAALTSFWIFNPKLIGIGAQATNDMAIIFIGAVFTVLLIKSIEEIGNIQKALFVGLSAIAASLIKGNGLVILIIFSLYSFYFFYKNPYFKPRVFIIAMIITSFFAVGQFGNYFYKYNKFGDPFINNQLKAPIPDWSEYDSSYQGRFGIRTIKSGFLSFHLLKLIESPFIESEAPYPFHRESFFTLLYGQFSNALFDRHPYGWISKNNDMLNFSRINYVMMLPILFLFGLNWFQAMALGVLKLFKKNKLESDFIHALIFLLFLIFCAKYSINYRDFSNIKIIFIFPALLSMIWLLRFETNYFRLTKLFNVLLILNSMLMMINIGYLIHTILRN